MPTYYDFDPRNLPEEFLTQIGLAITCASQTEDMFAMAIMGCAGLDSEYGGAVTTHMTMPLKFSVLRSVAEIRLEVGQLDQLDDLLEDVDAAMNKRNDFAHSKWCCDPKTGEVFMVKDRARTSYQTELIPVTVDGLEGDVTFIYETGMNLMGFLQEHGLLPPIPEPRPRAHKLKAVRKKRRMSKGT